MGGHSNNCKMETTQGSLIVWGQDPVLLWVSELLAEPGFWLNHDNKEHWFFPYTHFYYMVSSHPSGTNWDSLLWVTYFTGTQWCSKKVACIPAWPRPGWSRSRQIAQFIFKEKGTVVWRNTPDPVADSWLSPPSGEQKSETYLEGKSECCLNWWILEMSPVGWMGHHHIVRTADAAEMGHNYSP